MKKTPFLLFLGTVLLLPFSLALGREQGESGKSPPNILFILVDDLGYGDLSLYGNPNIRTPHLDRLASRGMLFTDAYAASPVCSASRAGFLTGRIPSKVGVYDWIPPGNPMHLPLGEITLSRLLKDAGYDTCIVGKWHLNGDLGNPNEPQPDDFGFDHYFVTQSNVFPSHLNPFNFSRNGKDVGPLKGYACQLVTDEGIRWLRNRKNSRHPFFQLVTFHEPHEPIASPAEMVAMYPRARNEYEAQYFANVTNIDDAVGRLLEALEELGETDNTLVFFTSDNGPETRNRHPQAFRSYGTPGALRGMKLQLYEGGIRVPAMVRWPGVVKAGSVSHVPLTSIDMLPTFCEIAGIALPEKGRNLDGVSLASVFKGASELERKIPLFWHYYQAWHGPRAALREGDWKILGYWDGPDLLHADSSTLRPGDMDLIKKSKLIRFELYNLRDDIGERRDLSSIQPETLQSMSEKLLRLYREVQEEGPTWPESWLRLW